MNNLLKRKGCEVCRHADTNTSKAFYHHILKGPDRRQLDLPRVVYGGSTEVPHGVFNLIFGFIFQIFQADRSTDVWQPHKDTTPLVDQPPRED